VTTSNLQVDTTKKKHPHSLRDRAYRAVWGAVWLLLFRGSFRLSHRYRRVILRIFGAKIGSNVKIYPSVKVWSPRHLVIGQNSTIADRVDLYNAGLIEIGKNTTISQNSVICTATHDYSKAHMPLVVFPTKIEDSVWICMNVFVTPNVTISEGVVVGACSKVTKDLREWRVYSGDPAQEIKERTLA